MIDLILRIIFTIIAFIALYNIYTNSCECNKKEDRILDSIQIVFIYFMFMLFIDMIVLFKGISIVLISFFFVGIVRLFINLKKQKNVQKTKKKCDCVK